VIAAGQPVSARNDTDWLAAVRPQGTSFSGLAVLGKAKDSVAIAAHIGGPVAAKADTAFIDGIHIALYTAAGAAALAAIAVFLLLSRHTSRPATASTSHHAAPKVEVPA